MTYYTYVVEDIRTHERSVVRGRNKCAIPQGKKLVAVTGMYDAPARGNKEGYDYE